MPYHGAKGLPPDRDTLRGIVGATCLLSAKRRVSRRLGLDHHLLRAFLFALYYRLSPTA